MSQSIRATLAALVILGCLLGLSWILRVRVTRAGDLVWWFRFLSVLLILIPGALLIWVKTIRDKAPDFLARISRKYFERDGFCFLFTMEALNNVWHLVMYYQNRYSMPCDAVVYLRPTKVAFTNVSDLPDFIVRVFCQGGEFGKALKPWSPPVRFQGKTAMWDVGAVVKYSNGRGNLLGMRDGIRVAQIPTWIHVAGAMVGHIMMERPARTRLSMPAVDANGIKHNSDWRAETIWKTGHTMRS